MVRRFVAMPQSNSRFKNGSEPRKPQNGLVSTNECHGSSDFLGLFHVTIRVRFCFVSSFELQQACFPSSSDKSHYLVFPWDVRWYPLRCSMGCPMLSYGMFHVTFRRNHCCGRLTAKKSFISFWPCLLVQENVSCRSQPSTQRWTDRQFPLHDLDTSGQIDS